MDIFPLRIRVPRVPVAVQFTREGLVFVLLSLALGAAAVNTGNNILYLIFSLMLGLIVVSGMLSRRILRGLHAGLEFPSDLFAGVRNACYVSVSNEKTRFPSFGIRLSAGGGDFPQVSRAFFYIPPSSEVHGFARVVFPRRGVFVLRDYEIQTRFPFSFFVKIRRYFDEQPPVRVYPRIYHLSDEWLAKYAEGLLYESPYRGDSHQLLHLREYTPNDSSKRIHWKASARTQRFLVKEFQKEQGRNVYIYFDCYPEKKDLLPELDRAVSLAASLAFLVRRKGWDAVFVFAKHEFRVDNRDANMRPLLEHLTEITTGMPVVSQSIPQPDADAMMLVIRSRNIPSVLSPPAGAKVMEAESSVSRMEPLDAQEAQL